MTELINIAQKKIKVDSHNRFYAAYQIPYAKSAGRFQPAIPIKFEDLNMYLDCSTRGPIFPQNTNRLSKVMGHIEGEENQSERAFHLNIFSHEDFKDKPVLFWIHGGGWLTGGGALPWYDGSNLVKTQNIVVVTINYRIGVLGSVYQSHKEMCNFGLNDIIQALAWVHRYIHYFGGNPNCITVGGQSAGAWYTTALMSIPEAAQYIHRVLLQSFPGNITPLNHKQGSSFVFCLQRYLNEKDFNRASINDILKAQDEIMKDVVQETNAVVPTTFIPIMENVNTTDEFIENAVKQSAGKVDILAWVTKHETTAFIDKGKEDDLIHHTTYQEFIKPTVKLLHRFQEEGSRTELITIEGGNKTLGATHCYDLPLLFGNFSTWNKAPMLQNVDYSKTKQLSKVLQNKLGEFIRR